MSETNKALFDSQNDSPGELPVKPTIEITSETLEVLLPSRGLMYPPMHPLSNKTVTTIVEMTPTEEHILYDKKRIREGTVVDDLIQACMYDKTVNVNNLLGGDRDALFFILRMESFDPQYKFDVACPKCDLKQEVVYQMDRDLKFKLFDIKEVEQSEPFANRFKFKLPKTGFVVEYKYATVGDNKKMAKDKQDRKKENADPRLDVVYELLGTIVSINGVTDRGDIAKALRHMPSRDTMALRKHISKTEPGVDTTYDFKCRDADCGHEEKSTIPLEASFFFPHLGK
jgi:hypothetical protein